MQIVPENNTLNMEASTSKGSAANAIFVKACEKARVLENLHVKSLKS